MNESTQNPFGITREEILDLAAQKIISQECDNESVSEYTHKQINAKIKEIFESNLKGRVDAFLTEQMATIVGQEIHPVDIYGERAGKPTTIKATIAERAKNFWMQSVDDNGRESSYGGKPRFQRMFEDIVKDQFKAAIAENCTTIVAAFKTALEQDASIQIKKHIDNLIRTK